MVTGSRSVAGRGPGATAWIAEIAGELELSRRRTLALIDLVPEEALSRQICDFMSPLVWDLAHVADFEKLWLVDAVEGRAAGRMDERFDALRTPREMRGALSLPSKAEVCETLSAVRQDALTLLLDLDPATLDPLLRDGYVYRMVLQHEAQHQETMLQALDIPDAAWGWDDPPRPTSSTPVVESAAGPGNTAAADDVSATEELARVAIRAGTFAMGTEDRTRAYDNERPRHEVHVPAFEMERYPVTNGRWLQFIDDGGYRRAELWSAGGRAWLEESGVEHPQGWAPSAEGWKVRSVGRERPLPPAEPVQHVSFWEAEAFARWAGGRLPSEAEWEKAAASGPTASRTRAYPWGEVPLLASDAAGGARTADPGLPTGPPPIGASPQTASAWGVHDMLGSVYQWTSSRFEAYPGFEPFPYEEYSAPFFGDTYNVLRGSSWAAAPILWRNTYRNWDLRDRRQIFAGVRVVHDGS